jgi:hypothetical protein
MAHTPPKITAAVGSKQQRVVSMARCHGLRAPMIGERSDGGRPALSPCRGCRLYDMCGCGGFFLLRSRLRGSATASATRREASVQATADQDHSSGFRDVMRGHHPPGLRCRDPRSDPELAFEVGPFGRSDYGCARARKDAETRRPQPPCRPVAGRSIASLLPRLAGPSNPNSVGHPDTRPALQFG